MTTPPEPLTATCFCTAFNIPITLRPPSSNPDLPIPIPICHCIACRHATGVLFTTYAPILPPSAVGDRLLESVTAYSTTSEGDGKEVKRYFCKRCGCHVLRTRTDEKGDWQWEVATGVMSRTDGLISISRHECVEETGDGGAASWISSSPFASTSSSSAGKETPATVSHHHKTSSASPLLSPSSPQKSTTSAKDTLSGHCACHTIKLTLTRPNAESGTVWSPYADVIIPFHTNDPRIKNPDREVWFLRGDGNGNGNGTKTKYLAGTCACRSCRLISGFEIQTWAFVPRVNISISISIVAGSTSARSSASPGSTEAKEKAAAPLDFDTLSLTGHRGPGEGKGLRCYESSPGVWREFCGVCGATVFWHDGERPGLIDVSVGLLDASTGARAEEWLEWWCGRVSFVEEAEWWRPSGDGKGGSWDLVGRLAGGLKVWGEANAGKHG